MKVEFYYDSTVAPGSAFPCDNAKAVELVGKLAAKGVNAKATDPNLARAYMGQCHKLEWPYAINIPKDNGIEGECGYYEGSGPATL